MVISPKGTQFTVDVKGLYKKNFWLVSEKAVRKGLFYIFAFVPGGAPSRFFILTQELVNKAIRENLDRAQGRAEKKGNVLKLNFPGVQWKDAEAREDRWTSLPE